ncbi:hypothetical protein BVRB_9g222310 [Beta vulgaris subsp. vulgaris]|nr:hypothetical protein BVRB_9g222310 [Beta vulgaris subsp. vulgaris]
MEVSMFTGFTDLGMSDLNFIHHQLQVNSLDDLFGPTLLPNYGNNYDNSGSNQAISRKRSATQTDVLHQTLIEKPYKQIKSNNWNSSSYDINHVLNSQDHDSNNSTMLSFSNNSSNSSNQNSSLVTPKEEVAISNMTYPSHEMIASQASPEKKRSQLEARPRVDNRSSKLSSIPQQSMDHILAERRRREKLSQRFIALSAIIPGLKKMDKASVLGDAIKYVKQMQERVKILEEEAKKKPVESAVFVKRSYVSVEDDDDHLSPEKMFSDGSYPDIEVRFSDKDVLIRIHCEKKKGIFEKIISQIEEFHLVVISSSSLAFGSSALAVTIIAQMNSEFSMTSKDLVRKIHTTLRSFI